METLAQPSPASRSSMPRLWLATSPSYRACAWDLPADMSATIERPPGQGRATQRRAGSEPTPRLVSLQRVEERDDVRGAERLTPREGTDGIAESELDGPVELVWGDLLAAGKSFGLVDEKRHRPRDEQSGLIGQPRDKQRRQQLGRLIQNGGRTPVVARRPD